VTDLLSSINYYCPSLTNKAVAGKKILNCRESRSKSREETTDQYFFQRDIYITSTSSNKEKVVREESFRNGKAERHSRVRKKNVQVKPIMKKNLKKERRNGEGGGEKSSCAFFGYLSSLVSHSIQNERATGAFLSD